MLRNESVLCPEGALSGSPLAQEGPKLPQDHPLLWLWDLRNAEVGGLPPPRLSPAPAELPSAEMERLMRQLTLAAATRRKLIAATAVEGKLLDLEAKVMAFVPEDGLTAWVVACPPVGNGRELTTQALERALASSGVVLGVDRELLAALPQREDRYLTLFQVARGVAPVHGRDGAVADCFPRRPEAKAPITPQNQLDFDALSPTCQVARGTVLCRLVPPTSGTPGASVRGEVIPARDGAQAKLPRGRNTCISQDGSQLLAAADGHLAFNSLCFEVMRTLDIPGDVDHSTGSLNYLGDIHIHGDVRSGFTVRATGRVQVDGVIENTSVEAGGDLVVGGGVLGDGNAVLRVHKNLYANYIEHCAAYVRGDVYCNCLIDSRVRSDGDIHVTTGRGVIVGGSTHAAGSVEVTVLGARSEVRTSVALGGRPCEDHERREVLQQIQEMEEELARAHQDTDSPERRKQLSNLRLKTAVNRVKLEKFKESLSQRPARPEERQKRRLLAGTVYSGAVITIDGYARDVVQEMHRCTAVLENTEVRFV